MRTITFYSYKGGVGRTLALANVARYLSTLGQKVFTLDLDLEAPGLHYKLLSPEEIEEIQSGFVDYLHGFYAGGETPKTLADHVVRVSHHTESGGVIHLMPAGRVPSARYWEKLSKLDWHDLFFAAGARGIPFFLELKERIAEEYAPDYLLIDARTGITEVGGVATTLLPEQIVCLLVNNPENLEGARAVLRSIRRSPRLPGQPPPEILPALTRIPKDVDSDIEKKLLDDVRAFLNEAGEDLTETLEVPEVFVLHSEPELQLKESIHIGSEKTPAESTLLQDYLRLFTRMIPRETIEPRIGMLLNGVVGRMLDDPEGSQKSLETLTTFYPHPETYRALLKFYRIRRINEAKILRTAHQYWQDFKNQDPLLWEIITQSEFKPIEAADSALAEFIEAIWSTQGSRDVRIALIVSRLYLKQKDPERALELIRTLMENAPNSDDAATAHMRVLLEANHPTEACGFARAWATAHVPAEKFVSAWYDAVIASRSPDEAKALLDSPIESINQYFRKNEQKSFHLHIIINPEGEEVSKADALIEAAARHGNLQKLERFARIYAESGLYKRFKTILLKNTDREHLSDEFISFIDYLSRKYEYEIHYNKYLK
jgi:hypothetical protein